MAIEDAGRSIDFPHLDGRRWTAGWLGAIGVLLLLLLVGVGLLQWRQLGVLSRAMLYGSDDIVLSIYQTENEYLRLREAWPPEPELATGMAYPELQLRYDIFVSRVGLLRDMGTSRAMADDGGLAHDLKRLDDFLERADRQLGPGAGPPDALALTALRWDLVKLGDAMHGLALRAAHFLALNAAGRDETVRLHNRIGIALTVFLSALTLAFACVALRQLYRLELRRRVLEELALRLREARHGAESASAAKSAFLANMSHEIRTPFQGLLGMLSLLRETGLTPKQGDYLRTATESADHLLVILNDILDMSQLESGRMTLVPAAVDLRALLRDVESLMRPQAAKKSLAMHIDAGPSVPERLLLDATRVKQVLFNLLSNAIKFSDHGAVVLDVRRHIGADGEELEFVVTDTGIGMDEATVARLFTRFSQGDNSRSRRYGGTGLGLEISRNLARLMGGDITVHSRPSLGSSFSFCMPLRQVHGKGEVGGENLPASLRAAPALHVLVAEDHAVNRQYMAALLESQGHHAHFAADGDEAVRAVSSMSTGAGRRFDIVLMDLHMPLLDGIGATRAIRALPNPAAATLPIVALTADAFAETRDRCLLAGMNDFLTKPISAPALATSLRRLFGTPTGAAGLHRRASWVDLPLEPAPGHVVDQATINMALQSMPKERLTAMIGSFLAEAPATVARLRAAVRDAQPLDLRVHAHAARGAALNLGLSALAATAEALHEGAAHLPAHEIARLVQRFEDQLAPTQQALRHIGMADEAMHPTTATTR